MRLFAQPSLSPNLRPRFILNKIGPCNFLKFNIEVGDFHAVNKQMRRMVLSLSMEFHCTLLGFEKLTVILTEKEFLVARYDHGTFGYPDLIRS